MKFFDNIKEIWVALDKEPLQITDNKTILWALRICLPILGFVAWACFSDPDVFSLFLGIFWIALTLLVCVPIYGSNFFTKLLSFTGAGIFVLEFFGVILFWLVCYHLSMRSVMYFIPTYTFIGYVLVSLTLITLVAWAVLVKINSRFRLIIASRIIFLILAPVTCWYLFILLIYVSITTETPIYNFPSNYLVISYVISFLFAIVISFMSFESDIFSFTGRMDYLFLRSFEYDKNNNKTPHTINEILSRHNIKPLTIGNPSALTIDALFGDKYFYLPTTDWKTALDYYIKRINSIIVVIDTTPGVIWEIFSHIQHSSKFIYVVDDVNKYYDLLHKIKDNDEYQEMYQKLLLVKNHVTDAFAFWFVGNNVIYGKLDNSLERFIKDRSQKHATKHKGENPANKDSDIKFGFFASLEKLRKKSFVILGYTLGTPVAILFILFLVIFGLMSLVFLFLSTIHLADLYGIFTIEPISNFLSDSDKGETWFYFIASIAFLKFCYEEFID